MMRIQHILAFFVIPFLLHGCKKSETGSVNAYELTVEGGVSTYTTRQFIRLTKPASLDQENAAVVSNAKVSINDGKNDIAFREIGSTGTYTGIVEHNKNYYGAYTLTVVADNKKYMATDTLIPIVPIDANYIPVTVTARQEGLRLTVPKHTFGTSIAQQWLILTQGKNWSQDNFRERYPFSYSHIFGTPDALNPLTQQARIIDLEKTDVVNIYKFSLSTAYSTYLYNLFQETDWKGLLSPVPANVTGNISGNANGFFYATDVEMQKRPLISLMKN